MTAARLLWLPLAVAIAVPPAASAAGPPLPSAASGSAGAMAPGGHVRLVTQRAGGNTRVSAVRLSDNRVLRSREVRGRWAVPAVTINGGTTGLSADGRTLVLAHPERKFPPPNTELAVLDTRHLTMQREIALPGFFTVDAISPDGRHLYLIQYPGEDVLNYRVRVLDTRSGRLDARDVVDPRKPNEQMGGLPMLREVSRDGRWAYTLYGGGKETFIHALDTVGRTAACIDLEMLPPESDLSGVQLVLAHDERRIDVRDRGNTVATVDARTFAVTEPTAHVAPPPQDDDDFPWPALLIGGAIAALAAATVLILRRRTTAGSSQQSSV